MAQRWYNDQLRLDWRRRTVPERQTILEDVGLTGSFWQLTCDGPEPPGTWKSRNHE